MYRGYQDWSELEDELYKEAEDSEGSDVNSELEFQLYSQLHYSSIARELGDNEDEELDEGTEEKGKDVGQQLEVTEKTGDGVGEHNGLEENLPVSHDEGGHRKKKGHTQRWREKQRKNLKQEVVQQGDDERPRLSSSALKEVIVIDSSPEDITISDDTDDGVCLLKGRTSNSKPLQASTPSQRILQKRKSSSSLEPIVVSSGDAAAESESARSGSVSDSESESDESLENWMILGRGNQEGDQSISLNLEGADNNRDGGNSSRGGGGGGGGGVVSWSVSNKDTEAQICNREGGVRPLGRFGAGPNRYFADKKVTCHNCKKTGHLSTNCPTKKVAPCFLCGTPGHQSYDCPGKHCNNCGQPGHLFDQCKERAYWFKQCHRCGVTGHFLDACPEIWRQYHITSKAGTPVRPKGNDPGRVPPYCYNCSRRGHFGHACTQQRMFRGTYANAPFINHYDTRDDIRRRENRIRTLMAAHSLDTSTSQKPETPGPPKKRQKTNYSNASHHQDPNRHANQRSHQSPIIHKPGNSHIRFNKSATKFTPKKADKQSQGSSGPGKRWEPKREVPTTRDQLPPARPGKVVFDEADDLPRGGRHREGEKKCKKMNKNSSKGAPGVPFKPNACTSDRLFGPARPGQAKKSHRQRLRGRDRKKAAATEMYPTDENLFIIKQRKRQR